MARHSGAWSISSGEKAALSPNATHRSPTMIWTTCNAGSPSTGVSSSSPR